VCNVCVAEQVLAETKSTRGGFAVIDWAGTSIRVDVMAYGAGSEFKPARYKVRRPDEQWPEEWTETKDLAGSMSHWGFDVKLEYVPKEVRAWLLGKGPKPSPEA